MAPLALVVPKLVSSRMVCLKPRRSILTTELLKPLKVPPPAAKRLADRFFEREAHPANLLHQELAAAGGAFIVGQDARDAPLREEINEDRLSTQGNNSVKVYIQLPEGALDRIRLRDVSQVTGHSEKAGACKLVFDENPLKHLPGPPVMRGDIRTPLAASQDDHLDRQGANIDSCEGRRSLLWQGRIPRGIG